MIAHDPTEFNISNWFSNWRKPARVPTVKALDWTPVQKITDEELAQLRKLLKRHGTLSNKQVARLSGITKGEASKRVSKAVKAGIVSRVKVGKTVAITLH